MAWLKHYPYITALALSLLSLGVTISSPALVQAQPASSISSKLPNQWEGASFQPPTGLGNPDGREGGATRGGCTSSNNKSDSIQNKKLTALVPASGVGITMAEYPTFYWYLPQTTAKTMEFVLRDDQDREIYSTLLAVDRNQPGIMSLELPTSATLLPLEIEKGYYWQVRLVCQPSDRLADEWVEGSVVRVQPTSKVAQSDNAPLQEKLALYVESRFWHETLSTLVEMRRLNPNDRDISAAWKQLLNSVGLEKIAQEPIVVRNALVLDQSSVQSTKAPVKQAKLGLELGK